MRRCARATRRDSREKAQPSRPTSGSNQWLRVDTGLTDRNIAHRRKSRSRTLRRAIAGFDLIRFAIQVFPALLVNARHLQVAEGAAFSRRNPAGHLNFAARSTEPCVLHIAPAPTISFANLVGQFARVEKSTRTMPRAFPRESLNLLCAPDGYSAVEDRSSCAGQSFFLRGSGYPAHGICGRQHEQRKNKGWQDWLSPVLGSRTGFPTVHDVHPSSIRSSDIAFDHSQSQADRPVVAVIEWVANDQHLWLLP